MKNKFDKLTKSKSSSGVQINNVQCEKIKLQ
jgi:hypothetical protein